MHDLHSALYSGFGGETFATLAGDFEARIFPLFIILFHTVSFVDVLVVIGQEAGIRTRTVRFTGGDAAITPQS